MGAGLLGRLHGRRSPAASLDGARACLGGARASLGGNSRPLGWRGAPPWEVQSLGGRSVLDGLGMGVPDSEGLRGWWLRWSVLSLAPWLRVATAGLTLKGRPFGAALQR